jgi:hypothetical protein
LYKYCLHDYASSLVWLNQRLSQYKTCRFSHSLRCTYKT